MRLGIDFDNTLVHYDRLFSRLAAEAGLLAPSEVRPQKAIRALARSSPDGDLAWQALQGRAYGPLLGEAEPAPGALAFLERCAALAIPVQIISHKTEFASIDPTRTPLRAAALDWLRAQGMLGPRTGLTAQDVRFAASRAEKVAFIRAGDLSHFVDDLVETFLHPEFPSAVQAVLYAPDGAAPAPGIWTVGSWLELAGRLGFRD